MKFRPFLPATSIALAGIAAVLIWNLTAEYRHGGKDAAGFSISGRVVVQDANALSNVQVRVRWVEDGVVKSVIVPVRPDGNFTADRLQPGAYSITVSRASPEGEKRSLTLASKDVTVAEADVSGVVLELREPPR